MRSAVKMLLLCSLLSLLGCTSPLTGEEDSLKPRLVVLTDIGPAEVEPDDNESAVRLLSYADRFEIELIACSVGWNSDPYPPESAEYLYRVVEAYGKDVLNLRRRSGQTDFLAVEVENGRQELGYWPSVEYIRSRSMLGSSRGGIAVVGEGNDSPGSELLIKLGDEDDPRPIYVCAWGGANTLSQAIWRVKQTRTPEQVRQFVRKFRLYTVTDQDMSYPNRMNLAYSSHQWLRREFQEDLLFVWDESAWLNQNDLGRRDWERYAAQIQGCGALGGVYPRFLWGVEGDTPSFLHVMPNGLNDPEDPAQVSWGGYHERYVSRDRETSCWTNYQQPVKEISDRYEKKFYPDEFNDFAARMQWAAEGKGNRNPEVRIGGQGGLKPLHKLVRPGQTLQLDASASTDPDGDALSFSWWFQEFADGPAAPALSGADGAKVSVTVPQDASGKIFHLVCEVHDQGPYTLPAYRRVILKVK